MILREADEIDSHGQRLPTDKRTSLFARQTCPGSRERGTRIYARSVRRAAAAWPPGHRHRVVFVLAAASPSWCRSRPLIKPDRPSATWHRCGHSSMEVLWAASWAIYDDYTTSACHRVVIRLQVFRVHTSVPDTHPRGFNVPTLSYRTAFTSWTRQHWILERAQVSFHETLCIALIRSRRSLKLATQTFLVAAKQRYVRSKASETNTFYHSIDL